ncbi:MAG: glycogen/starch/alpha-glucan phosphorylase, partial [Alphaproteobacteria bacterium]|nr:glycogen/starch/alpha-glucan phosphorylase [Alphaproteobacteria bacterium]
TLDGANVEIRDHVGAENIFIFGLTAEEVAARRNGGYDAGAAIESSAELKGVLDALASGVFSPNDHARYRPIADSLYHGDWFMVAADFEAYSAAQREADALWSKPGDWTEKAILNTVHMGWFSSDRTIRDYARDIWHVSVD